MNRQGTSNIQRSTLNVQSWTLNVVALVFGLSKCSDFPNHRAATTVSRCISPPALRSVRDLQSTTRGQNPRSTRKPLKTSLPIALMQSPPPGMVAAQNNTCRERAAVINLRLDMAMKRKRIPGGRHSVTPYLLVKDVTARRHDVSERIKN